MTIFKKLGLATVLLALFIGCVQPPAAPNGEIETSDESGNTVTTQAVPTNGLKGDYYDNVDFTGTLKTRYDANINRTWNSSAPISGIQPTTYSVRWTGQVMPAFSQTYTFFVTSSDGARLMVNGQALVNDWVDGSSRVRSGTVALKANTKYDIRLEYYHNATNPGAVKLEWQSSSRGRQILPQASLFPIGSNLETAINLIKARVNVNVDLGASVAVYANSGDMTVYAAEPASRNLVFGVIDNQTVKLLYKLEKSGTQWVITDLLNQFTMNLGEASGFINSDGTQTDMQRKSLKAKMVEFVTKKLLQSIVVGQSTGVRPQGITDDLFCEIIVKPPPTCLDNACRYEAEEVKKVACNLASIPERLFVGVVGSAGTIAAGAATLNPWLVAGGVGLFVYEFPDFIRDPVGFVDFPQRWRDYKACLQRFLDRCLLQLTPIPVNERQEVNRFGIVNPGVRNSGVPSASKLPVGVEISRREFVPDPSSASSFTPVVFPIDLNSDILPGSTNSFPVVYTCPATPTTLRGTAKFYHDASTITDLLGQPIAISNPLEVLVVIECYTPNPLELVAALSDRVNLGYACENLGFADYPCLGNYWYVIATTRTCNPPVGGWPTRYVTMCGTGLFIDGHDGSATANVTAALNAAGISDVTFRTCRPETTVPWSNTTPPTTCVYGRLP